MATNDDQLVERLVPKILSAIRAKSTPVETLKVTDDTSGITSLPAYDTTGEQFKMVLVPVGALKEPAASAAAEALAAAEAARMAAGSVDQKIEDALGDFVITGAGTYQSAITDKSLAMPEKVGGLAKGTTVAQIEGKSYNQVFDDMLFPTVNPTFVAPSASISLNGYAAVQEVGAAAPATSNFTTSLNRGAIMLGGVKQDNRAGVFDATSSYIYADSETPPSTIPLGNTVYKFRAYYATGPQPKDNKGNNYGTPLAAGYVDSAGVTVNGTRPWYASTAAGSVKQPLVAWASSMSTGQFTLLPTGTTPQLFKLPRKCASLKMLNTISGQFETITLGSWTETTETINNTTYYVYTYNGAARGEVTLIATF